MIESSMTARIAFAAARWIRFAAGCSIPLLLSCLRADYAPRAEGSPQYPPLPRLSSILPLAGGATWHYVSTWYDSSGEAVISREELKLSIAGVYGRRDTALIPLEKGVYGPDSDSYDEFVYKYEWEDYDSGALVTYRDMNIDTPGVYIVGGYTSRGPTLLKRPRLWLAYPAPAGTRYVLSRDTALLESTTVEILGTREPFYCRGTGSGLSAVDFYDCYEYKETSANTVSYYYYSPKIGALGFRSFTNGILRLSYILQSSSFPD